MKTIKCYIPHEGYDPDKRDNPSKADLRVSSNFDMSGLPDTVQISCSRTDIEFRFRREGTPTTDYDVYNGHYYHDGDTVARTEYKELYISDPRYIDDKKKELPHSFDFTVELGDEKPEKVKFLVSSDIHLCGDESEEKKEQHNRNQKDVETLIKQVATLGDIDFYAICGDLCDDSDAEDENMFVDEFFERMRKDAKNIKCICEGWGNHDVRRKFGNLTNIQDGIRDRNEEYRNETLPNYRMSDSEEYDNYNYHYHYHWSYGMKNGKRVHFFMLNEVPGYGKIEKEGTPDTRPDYNVERDERNPFDSLSFLKEEIRSFGENDYYVLFFHINFDATDPEYPDRWWAENRTDFPRVLKSCKGKYLASFFGHTHSSAKQETLTVTIDNEKLSLKGYRCACKGANGAAHYLLCEITFDADRKPHLSVTSYSNDGKEEKKLT